MNTYLPPNGFDLWHIAGWTMIHFLWIGTLVALAGFLCRWLLRRLSPNVRYATSLACFVLFAALPIVISAWLCQNPTSFQLEDSMRQGAEPVVTIAESLTDARLRQNAIVDPVPPINSAVPS